MALRRDWCNLVAWGYISLRCRRNRHFWRVLLFKFPARTHTGVQTAWNSCHFTCGLSAVWSSRNSRPGFTPPIRKTNHSCQLIPNWTPDQWFILMFYINLLTPSSVQSLCYPENDFFKCYQLIKRKKSGDITSEGSADGEGNSLYIRKTDAQYPPYIKTTGCKRSHCVKLGVHMLSPNRWQ